MQAYPNQQGGTGLPADPTQQQYRTVFVDFNNPAPAPQYQCAPEVAQWLPVISTLAALEIQNNLQRNPLRMFMFNLYVERNFANQNHFQLVTNIADWLEMEMSRGSYQNPESCLQQIVPMMVEMTTCAQLRKYPALQGYVQDQQLLQHCVEKTQRFDNLGGEIDYWRRGRMQPQQQQQPQFGMQGGGGSWAHQQMSNQNVGTQAWGTNNAWMGQQPMQSHSAAGNHSLFSDRPNHSQSAQHVVDDTDSRYARRAQSTIRDVGETQVNHSEAVESVRHREYRQAPPAVEAMPSGHPLQAPAQQPVPAPAESAEQGQMLLADESGMEWRPTVKQPYSLAYNPRTHLLYHRKTATGEVVEVLRLRNNDNMDYEKHRVARTFGASPTPVGTEQARAKLDRMYQTLVEPNDLDDPELDPEKAELLRNRVAQAGWVFDSTLDSAWVVCQLGCMAAATDGKAPDIYHRRAKIAYPILDTRDQKPYIRKLAQCESYAELRLKLFELGALMNPELWKLIERKMTDAVNRVLNQQLSISAQRITSFVEDIGDITDLIQSRYGDLMLHAFLGNESESIRAALQVFEDDYKEFEDTLTDSFLGGYCETLENVPTISYLLSDVTLTTLSCTAHELEIELNENRAAMITSSTPFLLELARDIMENVLEAWDAEDVENDVVEERSYDRHFIRTADGRVLELTRGLISNNSMLLRLIH